MVTHTIRWRKLTNFSDNRGVWVRFFKSQLFHKITIISHHQQISDNNSVYLDELEIL